MDHVTTAQIAEQRGVSIRTVHRLRSAGDLPYITKLPGKTGPYLFDASVVERVFAAREHERDRAPAA